MAKRRKSGVIEVDFTGVKSGGRAVPDGRYKAKIIEWTQEEGKDSGEPYLQLKWEITSKKCGGATVQFDNYTLQPQGLWRLKGLLESMGEDVPDSSMDLDMDELVDGPECIIDVVNEERDGKRYPRVAGTAPLEDGGTVDEEEDEEKDDKPSRRKAKEREESDRQAEMDGKRRRGREREREDDDEEEDEKPARGRRGSQDEDEDEKPSRRRSSQKDDEEEDEEEDEPKSSGSRKLKKGAKVKFRDDNKKWQKGTVESIDKDIATVVDEDDETWEIECDELTVTG